MCDNVLGYLVLAVIHMDDTNDTISMENPYFIIIFPRTLN